MAVWRSVSVALRPAWARTKALISRAQLATASSRAASTAAASQLPCGRRSPRASEAAVEVAGEGAWGLLSRSGAARKPE